MMKKITALLIVLVLCCTLFAGCASEKSDKVTIYLLNWGEYLDPDLLEEFNAMQDDIVIRENTASSNEEMYTICATEGCGIDMVVPSEYMVDMMRQDGLLAELNLENIPNFQYVQDMAVPESNCTSLENPDKYVAVPYMCGTLGIVYNTTLVDDVVDSWDILWNEKYANQILMYDSVRDSLAIALLKLGYNLNSTDPKEIEEAGELLVQQKPIVLAYGTDDIKDSMISGSVALATDYSGAAMAAIMENPDLEYVVPKEASNIWVDSICVLESSEHKEACERFINFLCDPEIAARNSNWIGYTTPNYAALEYVDEELKEISGYMIDDATRERCTYYNYLGDNLETYYDAWIKVKASTKKPRK